jgi:transcriptional regulator with XRE-family HTH domain
MKFGELFKAHRIRAGKTLRSFCAENELDPGNTSKLERGKMAPPDSDEILRRYAAMLGVAEGSADWHLFMDTAAAERGQLPKSLLQDAELVEKLPVLFRTLRDMTDGDADADLRKMAEEVRRI